MADAALEPSLALLDGSLDGGNEAGRPEAEPFPLLAHGASGQFPVPGIAESEDVLIGDHLAACENAHKADPAQGGVGSYEGLIEFSAFGPGYEMTRFPLGFPLGRVLSGEALELDVEGPGIFQHIDAYVAFLSE